MLKFIFNLLAIFLITSCEKLESELEKKAIRFFKKDVILDQGYVYFDSIGNIRVELNNLEFATNPLYTEASYIGVWVYPRNANPLQMCCQGPSSECGEQARSCIKGVGFSNDLGFLGRRYIFIEPPKPFNKYADKYYIDIKVSDAAGVPRDYQGEYQPFSGPTNPVKDREIYDLYLGVFYNVFRADGGLRAINSSASIGNKTLYTRVDPDFLSPLIRIESRFFSQTPDDPIGSFYAIPHLSTWSKLPPLDRDLDKRKYLKINEIGNRINGITANDYIELYNPTDFEIYLDDVYLFRYTSTKCATLQDYSDRENLSGLKISPKSYLLLAREGSSLNPDYVMKNVIVGENDCFALVTGSKPIEIEEEAETDDFKFNILSKANALKNQTTKAAITNIDKRLIDFVGFADPDKTNYYLGEGPAPYLVDGVAISRCLNGNDTRNNKADFWIEFPTPSTENNCTFTKHINNANVGDVLISEVSTRNNIGGCSDTNGADDFIEIINTSNEKINLAGARLYYVTTGGNVSTYYTFGSYVLAPNSHVVVLSSNVGCFNDTNVPNALVRSSPFNLSSNSASIVLTANNFSFPTPQIQPIPSLGKTFVLDYLGYGSDSVVYKGLRSNQVDNYSISRCSNNNTSNALDFSIEQNTPGQTNSCSGAVQIASLDRSSLLITEILPKPGSPCNANDKFVEIYNTTNQRIQLGGGKLFYITSTPNIGTGYTFGYSIVEPNSYIVLFNATGVCYSSLVGVNSIYGTGINLSSDGASVALGRNNASIDVSSYPNITEGNNFIIDYVGYYSDSKIFKTQAALYGSNCDNRSILRIQPNLDTGNHYNDFICGANNGNPGVSN